MKAKELIDYYWNTWKEEMENGGGCTFKEWVEADGEYQSKYLDDGEEIEFSERFHNMID